MWRGEGGRSPVIHAYWNSCSIKVYPLRIGKGADRQNRRQECVTVIRSVELRGEHRCENGTTKKGYHCAYLTEKYFCKKMMGLILETGPLNMVRNCAAFCSAIIKWGAPKRKPSCVQTFQSLSTSVNSLSTRDENS